MGVGLHFSADSRDDGNIKHFQDNFGVNNSTPENKLPNPDPHNFVIRGIEVVKGFPIIYVNYPDCTNYEGNKILVYDRGFPINDLIKSKRLDPHFYTEQDSPIARFEPTQRGWEMAISFAKNYKA